MSGYNDLIQNTDNLTHRRKVYALSALDFMTRQAATDLKSGLETREVIVPALAAIVSGYVPTTGKGHADRVRASVEGNIDAIFDEQQEETA